MKTLIATVAIALLPLSALASGYGDWGNGVARGGASSVSTTEGMAATGGIAAQGMRGFSSVETFQGAANTSNAGVGLTFTEFDQHNRNEDVDGGLAEVTTNTFSQGTQFSSTQVIDRGTGTAGFGGGFGASEGNAWANGRVNVGGTFSW